MIELLAIVGGFVVSVVGFLLLGLAYLALIAYWRWLGEVGEKRHAAATFERDFIPEVADVEIAEAAVDTDLSLRAGNAAEARAGNADAIARARRLVASFSRAGR